MRTEMSKVTSCNVKDCSYNNDVLCGARAINVGGSGAICNAFVHMNVKCAGEEIESGVGACKMNDCRYNDCLICSAPGVDIGMNGSQAMCNTFAVR